MEMCIPQTLGKLVLGLERAVVGTKRVSEKPHVGVQSCLFVLLLTLRCLHRGKVVAVLFDGCTVLLARVTWEEVVYACESKDLVKHVGVNLGGGVFAVGRWSCCARHHASYLEITNLITR